MTFVERRLVEADIFSAFRIIRIFIGINTSAIAAYFSGIGTILRNDFAIMALIQCMPIGSTSVDGTFGVIGNRRRPIVTTGRDTKGKRDNGRKGDKL